MLALKRGSKEIRWACPARLILKNQNHGSQIFVKNTIRIESLSNLKAMPCKLFRISM